jgi:uncharacterized protein (UPF0335 family)
MSDLADVLREWVESDDELRAAKGRYWEAQHRAKTQGFDHSVLSAVIYLRGYDDAKAEAAHTEMLLREAHYDELENANARVRELAAELAVRMTVPEAFFAQPAQERDG